MPPNLSEIDCLLRLVDREIWIVTAGGLPPLPRSGLTATWVSQVSLDSQQPALLVGLAKNHFTAELALSGGRLGLHLLREDQSLIAWHFAKNSGREGDKFASIAVQNSAENGPPLLADCRVWFDCRVFARYDSGERWFFWVDVVAAGEISAGQLLREQYFFRQLSAEQKQQLTAGRQADIALQQSDIAAWRQAVSGQLK